MITTKVVFIPMHTAEDERGLRTGLLNKKIYPVFWDDLFPYDDLIKQEEKHVTPEALFERACEAIAQQGAVAFPESFKGYKETEQLISWCHIKKLPAYYILEGYELKSVWA